MSKALVDLSKAPGERTSWGRHALVVYLWYFFEFFFVTNPLQVSSRVRCSVLRLFGAQIGRGVIFRPRTRVKFPWKLIVGDRTWIGEGVWFHNQDFVSIGSDVIISQESMLTTGSHAHKTDMALITRPIFIGDGAWVTSRCLILGGVRLGENCLIKPMSVVDRSIPEGEIWGNQIITFIQQRFPPVSD